MLWKFNTLTEQFSLWSALWPRNLAVESLICHYPSSCQECGTWLVWRGMFLSATNTETSEKQIPRIAQQLFQAVEMIEFSFKWSWGTFSDHSCEDLGLLFHKRHETLRTAPCPDEALGLSQDDIYVFCHWRCTQWHLHALHSLLSPRSDFHLLSSNAMHYTNSANRVHEVFLMFARGTVKDWLTIHRNQWWAQWDWTET